MHIHAAPPPAGGELTSPIRRARVAIASAGTGAPEEDPVRGAAEAQRRLFWWWSSSCALRLACERQLISVNFVELMLLGFVSLLLVVFQDLIQKICIDESLMAHWLPCRGATTSATAHYGVSSSAVVGGGRRMLKGGGAAFGHCSSKVIKHVNLRMHQQW